MLTDVENDFHVSHLQFSWLRCQSYIQQKITQSFEILLSDICFNENRHSAIFLDNFGFKIKRTQDNKSCCLGFLLEGF